jgi:hypothetical protein
MQIGLAVTAPDYAANAKSEILRRRRLTVWQRFAKPSRNARAGSTPAASANLLWIADFRMRLVEIIVPARQSVFSNQQLKDL